METVSSSRVCDYLINSRTRNLMNFVQDYVYNVKHDENLNVGLKLRVRDQDVYLLYVQI